MPQQLGLVSFWLKRMAQGPGVLGCFVLGCFEDFLSDLVFFFGAPAFLRRFFLTSRRRHEGVWLRGLEGWYRFGQILSRRWL